MDYKEKYENLVEAVKKLQEVNPSNEGIQNWINDNIPELKENGDEKIKKALIEHFAGAHSSMYPYKGFTKEQILAWLEKQGEQKTVVIIPKFRVGDKIRRKTPRRYDKDMQVTRIESNYYLCNHLGKFSSESISFSEESNYELVEQKPTDKVEPKFHKGDWIINSQGTLRHIINVDKGGYQTDEGWLSHNTYEKTFHLWTIQDAKDGDVLSYNDGHGNDCIELIKSITDKKIEFWFCLSNGNHYEVFDGIVPYTNIASREDANPASKEQRDTLMKAMADAGYTFDFESKELRKVCCEADCTTTKEWSDEDEEMFKSIKYHLDCDNADIRCYGWLDELKERARSQWKPTAEQMKVLKETCVLKKSTATGAVLCELYHDLEKLREE